MKHILLLTAGLTISCLLFYLGWSLQQAASGASVLPPPQGPRLNVSPTDAHIILATALQHQTKPHITMTATIDDADQEKFQEHLFNIAPQKGWYAHPSPFYDLNIILPRDEIPEVEKLAQDPTGWVLHNLANPKPSTGPSSTDLVNVQLHVATPIKYLFHVVIGALTWIVAFFTADIPITLVTDRLLTRRRSKQASPSST